MGCILIYSHLRRSDGKPKLAFKSKDSAERNADKMKKRYAAEFCIYKCLFCDGWHLSKVKALPAEEAHETPVSSTTTPIEGLDMDLILSTKIPDLAQVYGGFRGRTLSSPAQKGAFPRLIKGGINQIIDLRKDYTSDAYSKYCEEKGIRYFHYPIAFGEEDIAAFVEGFDEFCRIIDAGRFYIACAHGLHRTDRALSAYWVFHGADIGMDPPLLRGSTTSIHNTQRVIRFLNCLYDYLSRTEGKPPMSSKVFEDRKAIIYAKSEAGKYA